MKNMRSLLATSVMLLSTTAFAWAEDSIQPFIVGGVEATPGEFPFIVSVQSSSGGHFCGGSLIKENWVLTAGHCAQGGDIQKIVLGLHDQKNPGNAETLNVKRVITHPQYNGGTVDYDFALVELETNSTHKPVALNSKEITIPEDSSQKVMSMTAGWGATSESSYSLATKLQKVSVPLIPQKACADAYKTFNQVTDRMICAGYTEGKKDACQGDSGGPLFMEDGSGNTTLIGVVSWGKGCARPNFPGVYSKVNSVYDWITETTK